jgi:sugar lactone lactonase YvrE
MNIRILFLAIPFLLAVRADGAAQLQEVASFPDQQVTGVGVSAKSGRVFVNFPTWSDDHFLSVAEIVKGKPVPFPNEEWNKPGDPATHFVCVQSVVVDDEDNLWILDPAAPKTKEIVPGGPKLIKVDLKTNAVVQTIPFGEDIAPKKSYLNDVRVDTKAGIAYLTESANGAIIVLDLKSGKARRLLADDASTQVESDVKINVDGKELYDQETKKPIAFRVDGIALDTKNSYLYYHAITARTFYRIKTADLNDPNLSEKELSKRVENLGPTDPPDGLLEATDGSVYLTNVEKGAIDRWDAATKKVTNVITDKRLLWPDTLAWGPGNTLYVTASQIQNMAKYNGGKSTRTEPYKLWKVTGIDKTK